jgi:hypothetical protein
MANEIEFTLTSLPATELLKLSAELAVHGCVTAFFSYDPGIGVSVRVIDDSSHCATCQCERIHGIVPPGRKRSWHK